jgi:hypothetical protein
MTLSNLLTTHQRWKALLAPIFLLLGAAVVIFNSLEYRSLRNEAFETHRTIYQAGTLQAASVMEQLILKVERAAEDLAGQISNGKLAREDYEQALANMVQSDELFYGGAIAFAPYALDPGRRLYAPYFNRNNEQLEFMYIEEAYDYTLDDQEWFVRAMAEGSRWSTPYFDEAVGDILMTTYSAVVYLPDHNGERKAVAVVTIDIDLDAIGNAVKATGLGSAGYAEIVNSEGLYLHSPQNERVINQESLFEEVRYAPDEGLKRLRELLASGKLGVTQVYEQAMGEFHLVSVAPIARTNWRILGNFTTSDVTPKTAELRHRLMFIIAGVIVVLCALLVYKQIATPRNAIISWPTSILISLVLAAGITQIWRVAMSYASVDDRKIFSLTSEQAVESEAEFYLGRARERLLDQPIIIPTGLYIESMKFLSSSDIRLVGTVWQKFESGRHQGVERGVIFPGAARLRLEEPFVLRDGETELVRWHFSAEWRFHHRYSRYPLVKDVMGIGILPRDTANNVLLLPDTDSFPYLTPSRLPGMSPDVFLLGWKIENTYFELRPWRQTTTFGRDASLSVDLLPELYFSAEIEKAFIHSIISNLTPLAIALIIAFITLLISTRDKEKLDVMRTGVGFDIGISTSIFFVVVLSHIGLRERIVSEEVFYLEYFYLLMYANLIWICCHSILASIHSPVLKKLTLGMAAKKIFFPINFLLIFMFTWSMFYA